MNNEDVTLAMLGLVLDKLGCTHEELRHAFAMYKHVNTTTAVCDEASTPLDPAAPCGSTEEQL